jgi:hypothetical protein
VGSTIATLPHVKLAGARERGVVDGGLKLIGQLIGDNEPDVQKALSWPLRDFAAVDSAAVGAFVDRQTQIAAGARDGHRAWVIRDMLVKLPPEATTRIKTALTGIRRQPGLPSTSEASATAAAFRGFLPTTPTTPTAHAAATAAAAQTKPAPEE